MQATLLKFWTLLIGAYQSLGSGPNEAVMIATSPNNWPHCQTNGINHFIPTQV